ncbi:MAG TPA: hypothetical protein VN493_20980 [Thermoanaerobaculia bacterium]|nr:hypothetical protein [Thermoanaerobaculia bacterium]
MDRWTVLLLLGQFAFVGFIIWVVAQAREARMRRRAEERTRMLERFSSPQELAEFLNTDAGSQFLGVLKGRSDHPFRALFGGLIGGIITLFIGFAFLIVVYLGRDPSGGNLIVPGTICAMAGLGILIAVGISAWLFRRAGLMSGPEQ